MNIIVERAGDSRIYCRPDTTWERENKDFYAPDSVNEMWWSPIVFARICKAGKCIGQKFASRYYDAVGFGALLYIGDNMPDTASASCADHTSLLPFPLYNPMVLDNGDNVLEVTKNEERIFSGTADKTILEEAVCKASGLTSLRIGDFVAVELSPASLLSERKEEKTLLKASFCENCLLDFRIIY